MRAGNYKPIEIPINHALSLRFAYAGTGCDSEPQKKPVQISVLLSLRFWHDASGSRLNSVELIMLYNNIDVLRSPRLLYMHTITFWSVSFMSTSTFLYYDACIATKPNRVTLHCFSNNLHKLNAIFHEWLLICNSISAIIRHLLHNKLSTRFVLGFCAIGHNLYSRSSHGAQLDASPTWVAVIYAWLSMGYATFSLNLSAWWRRVVTRVSDSHKDTICLAFYRGTHFV